MSDTTLLVTGATGNIGRRLVRTLSGLGHRVIAGSPRGESVEGAPGRVVDFRRPETLVPAFTGVDRLFLLFPLVPDKLALARHAAAAAREAGVKFVLRSSGMGADAASPHALARLQGQIDEIVAAAGLPHAFLRPNSFMQNWIAYQAGMIKAGQVYSSTGDGATSYVDVADIADAAARILHEPAPHVGQAYTLTGPEALDAARALAAINQASGRQAKLVPISEEAAVAGMQQAGLDDWTIGLLSSLNQVVAQGWTATVTDDVRRLTGHAPRAFADFARDNDDAWR